MTIKKLLKILKSVQEYHKSMWYSQIEVSIGRSLKKAKGKEKEKKLFMAFRRKAKKIRALPVHLDPEIRISGNSDFWIQIGPY